MYGWPFIDFLTKNNQSGLVIQSSCLPFLDYNISSSCLIKSNKIFNSILNSPETKNIYWIDLVFKKFN